MALSLKSRLPPQHQAALESVLKSEMEEHFAPGNVVKGSFDYMTFGMSSMIAGVAVDTPKGLYHLANDDYQAAGAELTTAMILIGTWGLAESAKALEARPAGAVGETGHVMPDYTGPKAKALARLEAIVRASEARGGAAAALADLTQAQIEAGGRYVTGNSANAAFVSRGGLPALTALIDAGGDLAAAERMLRGQKTLPFGLEQPAATTTPGQIPSQGPLNMPPEYARGGPVTPEQEALANKLLLRRPGAAEAGPVPVTTFPGAAPKQSPMTVKASDAQGPTIADFTGVGPGGERITVRTVRGKKDGSRVVNMTVDFDAQDYASDRVRDTDLPRAMRLAGMGDWRANMGHIFPFAEGGPDAVYNFERQPGKWNKAVKGKVNRRTLERLFETFVDEHTKQIASFEFRRTLTKANALQGERFVIRNHAGEIIFDVEVTTRGRVVDYLSP
jgi:hypothetical protein